jgi:hypothetical protein
VKPTEPSYAKFKREWTPKIPVRVWVAIGDLHAGSSFSLLPPKFSYKEGTNIKPVAQSRAQAAMWEYWQDALQQVRHYNPDTILNMADSLDGVNFVAPGRNRCITTLDGQLEAAKQILDPIRTDSANNSRRMEFVGGSDFHGSRDVSVDAALAGWWIGAGNPGNYNGLVANLAVAGTKSKRPEFRGRDEGGKPIRHSEVLVNVSHGASQAFIYQAMMMDRESLHSSAAAADPLAGFPNFDLIIHGHWHHGSRLDINNRTMVINPCWKMFEAYKGTMKLYARFMPGIGLTFLLFYADGEIEVKQVKYPAIPISDAVRQV